MWACVDLTRALSEDVADDRDDVEEWRRRKFGGRSIRVTAED